MLGKRLGDLYSYVFTALLDLIERGWVPEVIVRRGIRLLLSQRHAELVNGGEVEKARVVDKLRRGRIAEDTDKANEQHYELPTIFFQKTLGPYMKYSCCLFESPSASLAEAEEAMLDLYVKRADIHDGMRVLDLGCGWGSLTLYLLKRFPSLTVISVSNSQPQRLFIESKAAAMGLKDRTNVITCDANELSFPTEGGIAGGFDRIMAIESFEHMRNWHELLSRCGGWLRQDGEGRMFLHFFCHKTFPYLFEVRDATDWMTQYFFTGGIMPSLDLVEQLHRGDSDSDGGSVLPLTEEQRWYVDGTHYQLTSETWLKTLDKHRQDSELMGAFEDTYGAQAANRWFNRWRMFYLAVAECFGYQGGGVWGVAHVLLKHSRPTQQ
ncbi:unnamed protein product [Vitrella brassicaformis CCMP3155]|uniref:Polyketide synthase methyltransferase domain-containing protein n=2 Tax=Vitrella brassicaformis TaxID=1169539 RepID=A0A0G4EE33_VITBC|nr:unnamed protein product [Vitrella brassicaformis CCMP3155]|eukprot:CEL94004.1 unnamed protein product [Vitrella brassicaformis CCMP3155]